MDLSQRVLQINEKIFSNFEFVFKLAIDQNRKNIQTNSEAWMLIKVQCVIYQWIRLDKLYKPMGSFLQILNSFLN